MIARVLELSARFRGLVILVAAALVAVAVASLGRLELDAVPDLSEPQVILFTEWKGRSPTLVEDQITYPLTSTLLSAPKVSAVRGYSMFGMSFVYVLFEEGTDLYWARSRVSELSSRLTSKLPEGVTPELGPDATGIGWVYEYALVDRSGHHDLGELRTLQDFTLRYSLASVPGVAEVASVGGYERQYQVTLDPEKLRAYEVSVADVADALRASNREVGGRVLEMSGREHYVRGRGYLGGVSSIEGVVLRAARGGLPVRVGDVGTVQVGGDVRRGLAELDGQGETVGAIVVARQGENALAVIDRVKERIEALRPSLPEGVEIVPTYDRSGLIRRSIGTLTRALAEEALTVAVVILLFLLHARSALLPIVTLPIAVLLALLGLSVFHVPATIMSLGGIAIALGATVDAEIVMIEACHKKLEGAPPDLPLRERARLLQEAAREVTPAIFSSLLIVAISFVPIFGLTGQAGRLFRPLAFSKTFVMLAAALLSITLAPALRDLVLRGKIRREEHHPISRAIRAVYEPFVYVALRRPVTTLAIGAFAVLSAIGPMRRLGSEFMPPLSEGDLLYMPTTLPGLSIEEAKRQLERQDRVLASFPEVVRVFGKAGRAETATDPAPLSMVETVVQLAPRDRWPLVHHERFYSRWAPSWLAAPLRAAFPEDEPETWDELVRKLDGALAAPGWTNAFTMPIKTRIDMLTTGVRTPVGIKVLGDDLARVEESGEALERVVGLVPGARSVLFERSQGGTYVDITPKREALARYGLRIDDLHDVIESSVGGASVTTAVDGRRRVGVHVRLKQDFRSTPEAIERVLVPLAPDAGAEGRRAFVSLSDVATVAIVSGPPMIRSEAGKLAGYLYVDVQPGVDVGSFVESAKRRVEAAQRDGSLALAPGTTALWTGEYEQLELMRARMKLLVPLSILLVVVLLYLQFRNVVEVLIVLLSIPFALVGSVWLVYLLGYHLSTAVLVGFVALVGLAAQTGVVMIVYIDHAFERRLRAGKIRSLEDIVRAHTEGTVLRVRPKVMTVATMLVGLLPLLWATGSGADVLKRIAAPMVGGLLSSAFLTLELIPVVYTYWRYAQLRRAERTGRPLAEICGLAGDS